MHNILIIEDEKAQADLLKDRIQWYAPTMHVDVAYTMHEALQMMGAKCYESVSLDLNLEDSRGIDSYIAVVTKCARSRVVVYSGAENEVNETRKILRRSDSIIVKPGGLNEWHETVLDRISVETVAGAYNYSGAAG